MKSDFALNHINVDLIMHFFFPCLTYAHFVTYNLFIIILTTTPSNKGNKEGESQPNYNDLTILNQLYLNSKLVESDEFVNNFRIFFLSYV